MSNDKREKPLLEEARELANDYNNKATVFSERIKTFQSLLRSLKFRVKAEVNFVEGNGKYRLLFDDRDLTWGLYVDRPVVVNNSIIWDSLGLLEHLSIGIKVAASQSFQLLLENLIVAQYKAIEEIESANTVFDDLADKIGLFEEEAE